MRNREEITAGKLATPRRGGRPISSRSGRNWLPLGIAPGLFGVPAHLLASLAPAFHSPAGDVGSHSRNLKARTRRELAGRAGLGLLSGISAREDVAPTLSITARVPFAVSSK